MQQNVALFSGGNFVVPDCVRVLDILKSAGAINCRTWCGESDQIERAFAEAATHKPNMLVVLGGRWDHPHSCRSVHWNRHLSAPASGRDAAYASSGAVWRRILARRS